MHIHILGICGTFMGSLAVLAKQLGHMVSGSDANVYPPMSTQLEQQGIALQQGFDPSQLQPHPDLVVIGNAMARGNPAVEYVLDKGLPYCSGPQWLAQYVLQQKWVLAVAGTHGKTTTSAMLAWILEYAGLKPGFLIGGVVNNFPTSARLGDSPFFVVEADEYDSAFFDKRSKFVHYSPRTAIFNNLEFDHADIFPDLGAIQRQFHHLVRTIPGNGLIIAPRADQAIAEVLAQGCWSEKQFFDMLEPEAGTQPHEEAINWFARPLRSDGSRFEVGKSNAAGSVLARSQINWQLTGNHNVSNALAAVAAAHHVGVDLENACAALGCFAGVKRRMELRGEVDGIKVYDDFAHHPTAIRTTLEGMARRMAAAEGLPGQRLIAVIEPRSQTMKMGVHQQSLVDASKLADMSVWLQPYDVGLNLRQLIDQTHDDARVLDSVAEIVDWLAEEARPGDHIVVMSNGGFGGVHEKLLKALADRQPVGSELQQGGV